MYQEKMFTEEVMTECNKEEKKLYKLSFSFKFNVIYLLFKEPLQQL